MSGAALMSGNMVLGLLLKVCPNPPPRGDPCTPGDGQVLQLETITRLTDAFFIVPTPAAQKRQQQEARVIAEGQRQYDSMLVAREQMQKQAMAQLRQRADSESMARRGGRRADLPRLLRDVDELFLFGSDQRISIPCGTRCQGAYYPADTYGPYLHAALRLSEPVVSEAPPMPPTLATCTLRSSTAQLRDFVLRSEFGRFGTGAAWADRSRSLAAGEYWAVCKVDGVEFESNRIRLLRPTTVGGDIDLGGGHTADAKTVTILVEGTQIARSRLPLDSALRVTMPRPRRPDAPIDIVVEIDQATGQALDSLPPTFVRQIACSGGFTRRGPPTVERVRAGAWLVTQSIAPFGSRWPPGEHRGGCQGGNVGFFGFVLEIR